MRTERVTKEPATATGSQSRAEHARSGGEAPPSGSSRTLRNLIIAAFLALQIGLPLSYYLGDTPHDERFAWRMFSPVRLVTCQVELKDGATGQRIDPYAEMHVVWFNLMKRGRLPVVEAFAEHWCGDQVAAGRADPDLRVTLSCGAPDERALGICRGGPRDGDGDGVPDGYKETLECEGPVDLCFKRDCGEQSAAACHAARCRVDLLKGEGNLCKGELK